MVPCEIRVPAQPGTDYAEMVVRNNNGQCGVSINKRSRRGNIAFGGSVTLSKHQQIALRDWLNERWPANGRP
jgi:hypothetical protein